MENRWYAIYTKPKWEYNIVSYLVKRSINCYCPSKSIIKRIGLIRRIVYEPLFPSYIFVHLSESQLTHLQEVPGIISIVHWRNERLIVRDEELECIQYFINKYDVIHFEKIAVALNEPVKITSSPLKSYFDDILVIKDQLIKLVLPSLGYVLVAENRRPQSKKQKKEYHHIPKVNF